MATTFYLYSATDPAGLNSLGGKKLVIGTPGSTADGGSATSTVAGPTAGVALTYTDGIGNNWMTAPLNGVTISGTMTFNLYAAESNMSANVGAQMFVERCDGAGNVISTITTGESLSEIAITTVTLKAWTLTPTSTTLSTGDRIKVRLFGNDISGSNQASGHTFNYFWGDGSWQSFVQFNETITEYVAPSQDAPELYGRPYGNRGSRQLRQLLAV